MTAGTEPTTGKRGPGRPKATANGESGESGESGELLRCFVVKARLDGKPDDLAVRSTLAKAIAAALQLAAIKTEDGSDKYESVKVFQMRSSNVAFDTSDDDSDNE